MKNRILIYISLSLSIFLISCGNSGSDAKKETRSIKEQRAAELEELKANNYGVIDDYPGQFRVGFGSAEITPEESVPLIGYGNQSERWSTGYKDEVKMTAVAITDENDHTIVMVSGDIIYFNINWTDSVMSTIIAKCPMLNPEDLILQGQHTHAGGDVMNSSGTAASLRYREKVANQTAEAVFQALNNRAPATMHIGTTETYHMNFVRHWDTENGKYGGNNFGPQSDIKDYEDPVDPIMTLLTFKREDAKDIVLCFWQAHPTFLNRYTKNLSSDYVGIFRDAVEDHYEDNVDCMFVQGAAGELNCHSQAFNSDNDAYEHESQEWYIAYGKALADYAIDVYDNKMEQVPTGDVGTLWIDSYEAPVDHSEDYKATGATLVMGEWNKHFDQGAATAVGQPYGINSNYHAGAILAKFALGKTAPINYVGVFHIGDEVGGISCPREMFHLGFMKIRDDSPYKYTLCYAYGKGEQSYGPLIQNYEHDSYECNSTYFVPGTYEDMNNKFLMLLDMMKYGDESIFAGTEWE